MEKNDSSVIILGGQSYELVLSHRVLKKFCAAHKLKISQIGEAIDDYDVLSDLVLQMVRREDPNMTQAKLDEMLDEVPLKDIIKAVVQAMKASIGDEEAEGET